MKIILNFKDVETFRRYVTVKNKQKPIVIYFTVGSNFFPKRLLISRKVCYNKNVYFFGEGN